MVKIIGLLVNVVEPTEGVQVQAVAVESVDIRFDLRALARRLVVELGDEVVVFPDHVVVIADGGEEEGRELLAGGVPHRNREVRQVGLEVLDPGEDGVEIVVVQGVQVTGVGCNGANDNDSILWSCQEGGGKSEADEGEAMQ